MSESKQKLTTGELEILRVFWAEGKSSVRDVHSALSKNRKIAFSSVAMRIAAMEAKGLIQSVTDLRPKDYVAVVEQDSTAKSMVGDVLEHVFGGRSLKTVLDLWARTATKSELKAARDQLDQIK